MACTHREALQAIATVLDGAPSPALQAVSDDCSRLVALDCDPAPKNWRDIVEKALLALQIFDPTSETGKSVFQEVENDLKALLSE